MADDALVTEAGSDPAAGYESRETLDRFADALLQIAHEAETSPEMLTSAPTHTPVRRLDEVAANRNPIVTVPLDWR